MDGIELALAQGPFKIQAENFDSKYSASANTYNYVTGATSCVTTACVATQDVRVQAKYVEALYNITGEDFAKSYKSGAFGGITPSSVFMKDYGGVVIQASCPLFKQARDEGNLVFLGRGRKKLGCGSWNRLG
jgi:phosphate-selective porin